jgi:hypothetical protein
MRPLLAVLLAVVLAALPAVVSAQDQTIAGYDNFAPATNADLDAIVAALGALPQGGACDRTHCPDYSCVEANKLYASLGNMAATVETIDVSLKEAIAQYITLLDRFNADYERVATMDRLVRWIKVWKEAFLKAGRTYLDIASLASNIQGMLAPSEMELLGSRLRVDRVLADVALVDRLVDVITGGLSTFDDLYTAAAGLINAWTPNSPSPQFLSDFQSRLIFFKSVANDVISGLAAHRNELVRLADGVKAGRWLQVRDAQLALKNLGTLRGSVGQIVGKLLGAIADMQIRDLANEISDNEKSQNASNAAFAANNAAYLHLVQRRAALARTYAALQRAMQQVVPCAARCSEWRSTATVGPEVAGKTFGAILSEQNARLLGFPAAVRNGAAAMALVPGAGPSLEALPVLVAPRDKAAARYRLALCPATEGALLRLRDPTALATDLTTAERGAETRYSFAAPFDPGAYDLELVVGTRTLARAPLVVEERRPEESLDCGLTLVKGMAGTNGHLIGKSFDFVLGEAGTDYYLSANLTVTPGISCPGYGTLVFPVFGGVSREPEFFQLKVIAGDASIAKYIEQWVGPLTVGFDTGTSSTYDLLRGVDIPEGAKRVDFVKLHVEQGSANLDLVWGVE